MTNEDLIRQFLTGLMGEKTSVNGLYVKNNKLHSKADVLNPIARIYPNNILFLADAQHSPSPSHIPVVRSGARTKHIKQVKKIAEGLNMTIISTAKAEKEEMQEQLQIQLDKLVLQLSRWNKGFAEIYGDLLKILKRIENMEEKLDLPKNQILFPTDSKFDKLWEQLLKNPMPYEKDREYLLKKYVLSRMFAKEKKKSKLDGIKIALDTMAQAGVAAAVAGSSFKNTINALKGWAPKEIENIVRKKGLDK